MGRIVVSRISNICLAADILLRSEGSTPSRSFGSQEPIHSQAAGVVSETIKLCIGLTMIAGGILSTAPVSILWTDLWITLCFGFLMVFIHRMQSCYQSANNCLWINKPTESLRNKRENGVFMILSTIHRLLLRLLY